jgi:hypothetical protein
MTLREFIRENRNELDRAIARAMGRTVEELPYRNDEERRLWVLNDEGLYNWARSEGVRI